MISTRDLSRLPDVDRLKRLLQSFAMLDAIFSPEWEYRYYSFNANWGEREQMGSMRNGCGDDFFAYFNEHGCFLKGFDHESEMSPYVADPPRVWRGVLDGIPAEFEPGATEPAFRMEDTTFALWRRDGEDRWRHGDISFPESPDPDGSARLLSVLDGQPESYRIWASEYFEQEIPEDVVEHVFAHRPLTEEMVARLNPQVRLADLRAEIVEIGYPA